MDAENLDIKILRAKTKDLPLTKISTKWKTHMALVYFIQKSILLKNRVLSHCDHIATSPSKWEAVFANVRRLSPSMVHSPSQLSRSHLCPPVWVSVPLRCSGLRDPLVEAQRLLFSLGEITSLPGLWFYHAFCSPPWTFCVFRGLPLHVHPGIAALSKSHVPLRPWPCDWSCVGWNVVCPAEKALESHGLGLSQTEVFGLHF